MEFSALKMKYGVACAIPPLHEAPSGGICFTKKQIEAGVGKVLDEREWQVALEYIDDDFIGHNSSLAWDDLKKELGILDWRGNTPEIAKTRDLEDTRTSLSKIGNPKLKRMCRQEGMKVGGKKDELIARLMVSREQNWKFVTREEKRVERENNDQRGK